MKTTRINPSAAVLWASAFMLGGMILLQAGRLPGNAAYADQAMQRGDLTLMTARSGRGKDFSPWELLYVLDSRSEILLVYEVEDAQKKEIFLRDGARRPDWCRNARR